MADACTIVRPSKLFYPASDQVPDEFLSNQSPTLCTMKLLPTEDSEESEESGPPPAPRYKVEKKDTVVLLPGLQWEKTDEQKKNLPLLLSRAHSRIKHIQESPIAVSCRREVLLCDKYLYPVIVAGLILWSDGLNPNSSSKDHRGSVWTLLATLILNWEKKNPGAYTYPIAVGPDVSLSG